MKRIIGAGIAAIVYSVVLPLAALAQEGSDSGRPRAGRPSAEPAGAIGGTGGTGPRSPGPRSRGSCSSRSGSSWSGIATRGVVAPADSFSHRGLAGRQLPACRSRLDSTFRTGLRALATTRTGSGWTPRRTLPVRRVPWSTPSHVAMSFWMRMPSLHVVKSHALRCQDPDVRVRRSDRRLTEDGQPVGTARRHPLPMIRGVSVWTASTPVSFGGDREVVLVIAVAQLGAGAQRDSLPVAFGPDQIAAPAAEHRDQRDVVSGPADARTDDVAGLARRRCAVLDRGDGERRRVRVPGRRVTSWRTDRRAKKSTLAPAPAFTITPSRSPPAGRRPLSSPAPTRASCIDGSTV